MFIEKRIVYNPKGRDLCFYVFSCDDCQTKFENKKYNQDTSQSHFCSTECRRKAFLLGGLVSKKMIKTSLEKFGTENPNQSQIIKDKIVKTSLIKYGVKTNLLLPNVNKSKAPTSDATKLKISISKKAKFSIKKMKLLSDNLATDPILKPKPITRKKYYKKVKSLVKLLIKKIKRSGDPNFNKLGTKSGDNILKILINKFGTPNINVLNSMPFSHLTKWNKTYGVPHYMQLPEIKNKIINTMMKKYGVPNTMAIMMLRGTDLKATAIKRHATRKRNGTYQTSKEEDNVYKLLCEKFGTSDIERQADINGWAIDFHIKSLNKYVEYNGSYYHGLNRPIAVIKAGSNKHDKRIYFTFIKDQDKVKWFANNNIKFAVILDKDTKEQILAKVMI